MKDYVKHVSIFLNIELIKEDLYGIKMANALKNVLLHIIYSNQGIIIVNNVPKKQK